MSRSQNKKRKYQPPKGYEQWFVEYPEMVRLAAKAERDQAGRTDTYWHVRKAALEAAFEKYDLEVPNG